MDKVQLNSKELKETLTQMRERIKAEIKAELLAEEQARIEEKEAREQARIREKEAQEREARTKIRQKNNNIYNASIYGTHFAPKPIQFL